MFDKMFDYSMVGVRIVSVAGSRCFALIISAKHRAGLRRRGPGRPRAGGSAGRWVAVSPRVRRSGP